MLHRKWSSSLGYYHLTMQCSTLSTVFSVHSQKWVKYVQGEICTGGRGGSIVYGQAIANVLGRKAEVVRAAFDSSLNVMDSTPLPCDVHAHLMLKWAIHGTIVFQSCQGKGQNRTHSLQPGVITIPQSPTGCVHSACYKVPFILIRLNRLRCLIWSIYSIVMSLH